MDMMNIIALPISDLIKIVYDIFMFVWNLYIPVYFGFLSVCLLSREFLLS